MPLGPRKHDIERISVKINRKDKIKPSKSSKERQNRIVAIFMRIMLPGAVVEVIARSAALLTDIIFFDRGAFAEARVRAKLLNLKYGFRAFSVGRGVVFEGADRIWLADGVVLHHGVVLVAGSSGYCRIGARSHVSHYSVLAGSHGISIGVDTAISSGVAIYSASNDFVGDAVLTETPLRVGNVNIGDRVLIGANAMIMPGVTLECDCAVGANAVALIDVRARSVVAGVPAKPIYR